MTMRCQAGLPPRVRAYLPSPPLIRLHGRSTPACAGLPPALGFPDARGKVYPRVCGLTVRLWAADHGETGLPPRVRAYRRAGQWPGCWPRSTPACAGLPTRFGAGFLALPVYPRVCGLTLECWCPPPKWSGLPPRVRAYRWPRGRKVGIIRSTPACAGLPLAA